MGMGVCLQTATDTVTMGDNVIQSLRGKVHKVPRKHKWRVNTMEDRGINPPEPVLEDEEEEEEEGEGYAYNYLPGDPNWTPMNANLHMQGIKVVVHNPVPETAKKANSHDTTLMLLDLIRQKKQNEVQKQKDEMIRKMAMEQKKRKEEERRARPSWM